MSPLRLLTFGELRLVDAGGRDVRFPQKALLLLVRLRLSEGCEISREDAAAFLWNVDDHALALANLRKMLSRVQAVQGEIGLDLITSDGRRLKLATANISSDLDLFDDAQTGIGALVELCDRGFLRCAGESLAGAERWAETQRVRLASVIRNRLLQVAKASPSDLDFVTLRKAAFFLLDVFPDDNEIRSLVAPPTASGRHLAGELRMPARVAINDPAMSLPAPPATPGPRVAILPPGGLALSESEFPLASALVDDVAICLCALRAFAMVAPYTSERIRASTDKPALLEKHDITYVVDTRLSQRSLVMQIIFVPSDSIIFAERYELRPAHLAESRRALAEAISNAILGTLARNEVARVDYELNPQAYRRYLTGLQQLNRLTLPAIRAARRTFRDSLKDRADFAYAFGGIARTYTSEWVLTARGDRDLLEKAEEAALAAIDHGPDIASGHKELGRARLYLGQLDESLEALESAEQLSPHYADAIYTYADTLVHASRPREGLEKIERAIALNPLGPDEYFWSAAGASFFTEDYSKSIDYLQRMNTPASAYRLLAASLAMAGDRQRAQHYRRKDLQENPHFSLRQWLAVVPIRESWQKDLYREGLMRAGYED